MESLNSKQHTLIFADGYSYTEILPAPENANVNANEGNRFTAIFHALFTEEKEIFSASGSGDNWTPKPS